MKSISKKIKPFTFEDFEEGLMLAGMISPSSQADIEAKDALEAHDKAAGKSKSKTFFYRALLAAEIASQLHPEPTFGHVKFQKLMFLCEHVAEMNLDHRYTKQVAGPFDNKFMHTIDKEFEKQKWFKVEKLISNNITRYKYFPLEKCDAYKPYYTSHFSSRDTAIKEMISLFKKDSTDNVEIVATVYACYIEIRNNGENVSNDKLLDLFFNWAPPKKRFSEKTVLEKYEWMLKQGILPQE